VQHSRVKYSTLQYSTVKYSKLQYSTVSAVQYSTVQYSAVQYSTVQCSRVKYSKVQKSKVQYIFTHNSKKRHNRYVCYFDILCVTVWSALRTRCDVLYVFVVVCFSVSTLKNYKAVLLLIPSTRSVRAQYCQLYTISENHKAIPPTTTSGHLKTLS
jgi:hypothetical protein